MATPNLRTELNNANPNRTDPAFASVNFGSTLNALIKALTFTETGVVPASNVGTLANAPEPVSGNSVGGGLLRILATAETGTVHEKLLKIGVITGTQAITPAPGECVWDGGKKILFNTADAVTAFSALYTQAADTTASVLQRSEGVSP